MSDLLAESVAQTFANKMEEERVKEKEQDPKEEQELKEQAPKEQPSDDDCCAEKECACHDDVKGNEAEDELESDEDPVKEVEDVTYEVVRVRHEYQYFPPGMSQLAFLVLFLHLLNAVLQLSERSSPHHRSY